MFNQTIDHEEAMYCEGTAAEENKENNRQQSGDDVSPTTLEEVINVIKYL